MGLESAALIGLGVVNAGSALLAGRAGYQEEALRRQQLKLDQKQSKLAALEDEVVRVQELNMVQSMTTASIAAMGRGALAPGSSIAALLKFNRQQADRDIRAIRLNQAAENARIQSEIKASKKRGRAIRTQSLLNVARAGIETAQGVSSTRPGDDTTQTGRTNVLSASRAESSSPGRL